MAGALITTSAAELAAELRGHGGRLIGLDVGTKTIGLATCDAGWSYATPAETLRRTKFTTDLEALKAFIARHGIVGVVVGLPGADLHTINEEHGYVRIAAGTERPAVGSRLQVIPNHACGCVNLHDGLLAVRGGVVDHVILVAGRGLVR